MADQSLLFDAEAESSLTFKRLPYQIRSRLNEFTGAEFKVWICLLSHVSEKKHKRAWAGLKLVMRETGLSRHGVEDAVAGLRRKGWITRYQTRSAATGQRTTATSWCKWAPVLEGSHWERVAHRTLKTDGRHRTP